MVAGEVDIDSDLQLSVSAVLHKINKSQSYLITAVQDPQLDPSVYQLQLSEL